MPRAAKVDHSKFWDEFQEWQFEQEQKAVYWTDRFKQEALKEPTYGKALDWIDKATPDLPDSFIPSTERLFINWNREFITDAKTDIWKKIKGVEINDDDRN